MIFRFISRLRRPYVRPTRRRFSTESRIHSQTLTKIRNGIESPPLCPIPPPPNPNPRSLPLVLASGTLISSLAVAAYIWKSDPPKPNGSFYADLEETLARSKTSLRRVYDQMSQTAAAAAVLWKSLESLMSVANQEVRSGFELRVAALISDIAAASAARREAIVGAGGGAVVDWLLESVAAKGRDRSGMREEAARALAYLVDDSGVSGRVLGRPGAVPNLLRFIFSFQPKNGEQVKYSSLDNSNFPRGRSMLVAALMDIVTSNCEITDDSGYQSLLPDNADTRDIAAALEVIEEGGMHLDDQHGDKEDDGDSGMKGIGIKVLGGTSILGFVRTNDLLEGDGVHMETTSHTSRNVEDDKGRFRRPGNLASAAVPGLWDDLQREHVAVPFAAWALANWALASKDNRSHIQELDRDGHAIMTALMAPERTVKWHGSLVARALLDDQNLPLTVSVPGWSSSLLSTAYHASKVGDISLAQVALSAFLISVDRSDFAKVAVMDKGLHLMREIAKHTERHKDLQESLARVLELLYTGGMHLSLDEGQRWSGILLRWVFGAFSSDVSRVSARKILSFILEDYGPASITISQGWLAILLSEVIDSSKKSTLKGSSTLKTDSVKTQIDQSNALSAAQVVNQLGTSVISMASNQLDAESDSFDRLPIADFFSFEPFATLVKNTNKNNLAKIDAADSASATLKSVKALSELCSEDAACQNRMADLGVLCLLRRLLLSDDYEKLAAIETYDASRAVEMQDRGSTASSVDSTDPSSVRVPPTAHIRKHAARLLRLLSLSPEVKKVIAADESLCKWLEDCASGKSSCCNDLKTQSNARATLLNVLCTVQIDPKSVTDAHPSREGRRTKCPQYEDMIFLINPELPHWKCPEINDLGISQDSNAARKPVSSTSSSPLDDDESFVSENSNTSTSVTTSNSVLDSPLVDIIFIHGLRGGPFKSWRIADNKSSTTSKSGLVENIDQEAGKEGTCWPREWLSVDFPYARLFTVKYKTNLSQWSGASLPLQEVSSMLLQKLVAAGIGDRPLIFITHSMGGLVVKQMLYQAKIKHFGKFVKNTIGVVFYSCPHFGSKLADMPWRMGMVFRPAPTIGELRSGSPRLVELNDFIRHLNRKGLLEVLSFSEVTPIVEGYGGWAFRMEIVPIESAYPGFGELVVLDGTDHINSCKPVNRTDPSYAETLEFLQKLIVRLK